MKSLKHHLKHFTVCNWFKICRDWREVEREGYRMKKVRRRDIGKYRCGDSRKDRGRDRRRDRGKD